MDSLHPHLSSRGMWKASDKGLFKVFLLSNAEVVQALNDGVDWAIKSIVLNIKALCSLFVFVSFVFKSRNSNGAASLFVKFELLSELGYAFFFCFFFFINTI